LRILIADDHETVRKGVCAILTAHENIQVCGEAANGEEAVQMAFELKPDLIVLDLSMPVLDGFSAAKQIRKVLPSVPILILSMQNGQRVAREAQLAGAQGFISKSEAGQVLLEAISALMNGQTFFNPR
jgi:two-component system nitrate/nitrite response regulator NarL